VQKQANVQENDITKNKCVSMLARRKSHHTPYASPVATAPDSQCPPGVGHPYIIPNGQSVIPTLFRMGIHPGSNVAAPVTPRQPMFTKRG